MARNGTEYLEMKFRAKILSKRSQACRRSWRFGLNCFREMKVSLYIVFGGSNCQRRQNPVARGDFVARGADFVARRAEGDGGDGVRRLSHSKNILRS